MNQRAEIEKPSVDTEAIAARVEAATPGPWVQGEMPEWEDYRIISASVLEDWEPQDDDPPDWTPPHKVVIDGDECSDEDFDFILNARQDIPALLAALATAEQAAEDLAEDRANWRAESKGYEAELAAAEAVVEAAEQMVDAIDEKPSLEWVAYASSLNDALNAYHKATGPQAETES